MSSSKWIKNANRVWGSKQIVAGFIKVTVECTYFSGIIQNETNEKKSWHPHYTATQHYK